MEPYREKLILTYNHLLEVHEELLTRTINVAMTGELEDIHSTFKPGDTFQFDKEMFRGTSDQNLKLLLDLHDDLENRMNSFANINNITEEELEDFEGESLDNLDDLSYNYGFKPKYRAGEIVAYEDCGDYLIGVITNIPLTFEERKQKGYKIEGLDNTDQVYNIEYIDDCGVLQHSHISEENLEVYLQALSIELKFLDRLSRHFSGETLLNEKLLSSIRKGKIYLRNKKTLKDIGD